MLLDQNHNPVLCLAHSTRGCPIVTRTTVFFQ
jgi:hypothetical protein